MFEIGRHPTAAGTIVVTATERADGDFHPLNVDRDVLEERQLALTSLPWTMIDQVHGTASVTVAPAAPWEPIAGRGDVVVARRLRGPIAIWAADCAPLMLIGTDGAVVGVHAGWRGLAAGVVDIAIDAMQVDPDEMVAVLGPCIRGCCYEFGDDDLEAVAAGVGAESAALAATTRAGKRSLDVPTAVVAALRRRGVETRIEGSCTGCDDRFFSHRTRGDAGRHALIAARMGVHDPR